MSCHFLLQGIFPSQRTNPHLLHLLHWQAVFLQYVQTHAWAALVAQTVKNLPEMWETWVQSLGWEDPLEKVMATHSSILAGESSWTEEPGGLQSMGSQRVRLD